ncbi:sugar phosphate isomerase/epimerase, partial [Escherichia coli]|nr:sugar phosphate isomerase/epimerase [Escherichia coli]
RELCSAEELNALPSPAATIESHGLLTCYSAPQALLTDNGELNPDLPTLLAEAQTLNALWLKLSLGHFLHNQQLDELRDILSDSGMALVLENDQTDCGQLAPMQRAKAACRVQQLEYTLTVDMGNWLWIRDSPEEGAGYLK